ncbi:hypothetical protein HK096_008255 [Nowakowskiella sp. JEL0078]|nr:hypothetical protein HK096_008255 [Nowakowskiella sp. JEL0078]
MENQVSSENNISQNKQQQPQPLPSSPPASLLLSSAQPSNMDSSASSQNFTTKICYIQHRLSVDTVKRKFSLSSTYASLLPAFGGLPSAFPISPGKRKASSPVSPTLGGTGLLLMSNPRSISFFIALDDHLVSPSSVSARYLGSSTKRKSLASPPFSSQSLLPHSLDNHNPSPALDPQLIPFSNHKNSLFHLNLKGPSSPWSKPSHPWARFSPDQLSTKMNGKLSNATQRRSELLNDKREKLRLRADQIKYRIQVQKQRERMLSHNLRLRTDCAIKAANLKRQLILKKSVERFNKAVERAQTVAMVQRLKKVLELRKAYSESFAIDMKDLAITKKLETSTQFFSLLGNSSTDDFELGINEDEDEETLQSPCKPLISTITPFTRNHQSFISDANRLNITEIEPLIDNFETSVSHIPNSSPSPLPHHIQETFPNPTAVSTTTFVAADQLRSSDADESRSSDADQTLGDDTAISDNLADIIRKTQSLPDLRLEDLEESEYSEFLDLLPPVTRFTLRELDLEEILSNPQLRHDLYFDPNLQFKPNLDGERGELKQARQENYWEETSEEIRSGKYYRVPLLLFEIRSIMLELLPPSGASNLQANSKTTWREEIERNLDVSFIAQQIEHNVLNVVAIVEYIAELLKANCAPARDLLVDTMVEECHNNNFAESFQTCFELLEVMKLDYANHQLHKLRPYVVENAVDFEWRWFKDQIEKDATKLDDTTVWLQGAFERSKINSKTLPSFPEIYHDALIHLIEQSINFSDTFKVPETLCMDTSRLVNFYNDWQDITIMASLLIIFKQSCTMPGKTHVPDAVTLESEFKEAKKTLWILLNDGDTSLSHVTLQMAAMAGRVRGVMLDAREESLLAALVDKTLSPDSKVYELVSRRVAAVLRDYLIRLFGDRRGSKSVKAGSESDSDSESEEIEDPAVVRMRKRIEEARRAKGKEVEVTKDILDVALLAKFGLAELEQEMRDLCERISKLSEHNRAVYAPVYVSIYSDLRNSHS